MRLSPLPPLTCATFTTAPRPFPCNVRPAPPYPCNIHPCLPLTYATFTPVPCPFPYNIGLCPPLTRVTFTPFPHYLLDVCPCLLPVWHLCLPPYLCDVRPCPPYLCDFHLLPTYLCDVHPCPLSYPMRCLLVPNPSLATCAWSYCYPALLDYVFLFSFFGQHNSWSQLRGSWFWLECSFKHCSKGEFPQICMSLSLSHFPLFLMSLSLSLQVVFPVTITYTSFRVNQVNSVNTDLCISTNPWGNERSECASLIEWSQQVKQSTWAEWANKWSEQPCCFWYKRDCHIEETALSEGESEDNELLNLRLSSIKSIKLG